MDSVNLTAWMFMRVVRLTASAAQDRPITELSQSQQNAEPVVNLWSSREISVFVGQGTVIAKSTVLRSRSARLKLKLVVDQ